MNKKLVTLITLVGILIVTAGVIASAKGVFRNSALSTSTTVKQNEIATTTTSVNVRTSITSTTTSPTEKSAIRDKLIQGPWFTPHFAPRRIVFFDANSFKLYEGDDQVTYLSGSYEIAGENVILSFEDKKHLDLSLAYSVDPLTTSYLKNKEAGEYFVLSDSVEVK